METFAVFMLLVTCSPDKTECKEVPTPVPAYMQMEDCKIDLIAKVKGSNDPELTGACIEFEESLMHADAEIVWDVTKQGELIAGIVAVTPDEQTDLAYAEQFPVEDDSEELIVAANN